jgi:hypothetical protein
MERKALETSISLHGGPVEHPVVGSFTRDFERQMNGASLSVGAL